MDFQTGMRIGGIIQLAETTAKKVDDLTGDVRDVTGRVEKLERGHKASVDVLEKISKDVLRVALWAAALWLTGSIDAALKIAGLVR